MSACYSCAAVLNKANRSVEHIIPNSIGGTLKSYRLLCRQCNRAYGMTIDAALANDFESLTASLNIKRDRHKVSLIENTIPPKDDLYHLINEHENVPAKPTIKLQNNQLFISGKDKQQIMQIASSLNRKFPYIDLDSIEKKLLNEDAPPGHKFTINFPVGDDLFMRSVAKIAVNYYLMKVRGTQHLARIIKLIDGIEKNQNDIHYYPLPAGIGDVEEISHLVAIKADAASRLLYAHVVLFNTYSLVVILCDTYEGDSIDYCYRYDILRHEEIKTKIVLNYNRDQYLKSINVNKGESDNELRSSPS